MQSCLPLLVLPLSVSAVLQEAAQHWEVPRLGSDVDWGAAIAPGQVRVSTRLEQNLKRRNCTSIICDCDNAIWWYNRFCLAYSKPLALKGGALTYRYKRWNDLFEVYFLCIISNENHNIPIAMSPSRADPVLPWLGVFKCLYHSHCTVWGYLII